MSGHTPGPWSADADPYQDGTPYFRFSGGNMGYGDVDGGFSFAGIMQEADARLIAAAPDLLEALEGLIDLHSVIPDDCLARIAADALIPGDGRSGLSRHEATLLIAARAAVAKARPTPEARDGQ